MNFFFFIETLKRAKRYNLYVGQNNKLEGLNKKLWKLQTQLFWK